MYDVYKIREQFPMLNNKTMQGKPLVFLDNASTTFKPKCVIDAVNNYYLNLNSNSSRGDYDLCEFVNDEVDACREIVAKFVNCDVNEVVFTSGDTMGLNLIGYGYGLKFLKAGDEVILSEAEHASNMLPWFKVQEQKGIVIKTIPLDENGNITAENLKKVITKKTKVVALAMVGNVLGQTVDMKAISKVAHEFGAIVICDGAQSVPHVVTDFKDLDVDFLTFSGHKLCAPTGIGCLIGKYSLLEKMDTFLVGGGNNETFDAVGNVTYLLPPQKFEAGTLNLAGIFGLRKAIEFLLSIGLENIHNHENELKQYALDKLKNCHDLIIYNKNLKGSILTFNKVGVFAQDEATLLNYKGIAVRSGKHCAKALDKFLNVSSTVRASFYLYNTKEDVDILVDALINGGDFLDAYFHD